MLQAFMFNKPFPFGPLTNQQAIQPQVSEGEESDVDITELGVMPNQTEKKEDLLTNSAIYHTAAAEGKGGPRVSDVVDLMIDLTALKEVKNINDLPIGVTQQYAYLTLQGIENNQQSVQLHKRISVWLKIYDKTNQG